MTDVGIGRVNRRVRDGWVTLPRVLVSELIKLGSLRSYVFSFAIAYILLAGFGLLTAYALILQQDETDPTVSAEPGSVLAGVQGVQLLIVTIAVVYAASEFSQQTIQPTYLSVPKRLPVIAAKMALIGMMSLVIGVAGGATALLGASLVLNAAEIPFVIAGEHAGQLIFGTGLYLMVVGVVGLSIGILVRSLVGGLLTAISLLSVLPLVLGAAPFEWLREASAFLPSTAGLLILQPSGIPGMLAPWTGLAVAAAWAVLLSAASALITRSTDA